MPLHDLSRQTIGRLKVMKRSTNDAFQRARWLCQCECGRQITIIGNHLTSGNTQSCGCIAREMKRQRFLTHGWYGTRTHQSWQDAKQRCFNHRNIRYPHYGGRGITMSHEWREDFSAFLRDMGKCPEGRTLDRIDNDGPYDRDNCRWATIEQQSNNTSRNRWIIFNGERKTAIQWSRTLGISIRTITDRLSKGWPPARVLMQRGRGKWNSKP